MTTKIMIEDWTEIHEYNGFIPIPEFITFETIEYKLDYSMLSIDENCLYIVFISQKDKF